MGSNVGKPPANCPLCNRECRNQTTLRCSHTFCQGCIGELWSVSAAGPYYCPECNYEYRKLPAFDGASTSYGANTNWTVGKRLSERYGPKKVLGKRKFSSTFFNQSGSGYILGRAPSSNDTATISNSSDEGRMAKKKKVNESPSSEHQRKCDISTEQGTQSSNSTSSKKASSTESSMDMNADVIMIDEMPEPSCSTTDTCQSKLQPSTVSHSKESIPKSSRSFRSSEEQTPTPPTLIVNEKSLEISKTPNTPKEKASSASSVPCHYCSSQNPKSAVKTCLVCGASMCVEHLRAHLESPVFQGHPLVPAVDNVAAYRCQEHQEMNRIFCRPCGVCVCTVCTVIGSHKDHACISIKEAEKELRATLKCEMEKIQTKETAVLNRVTDLTEKKRDVQEMVSGARTAVAQQYQAIRDALELEEQHALSCVAQEETRVLGSVKEHLDVLNNSLQTFQSMFKCLQTLAEVQGDAGTQGQAFIMEYRKITEGLKEQLEDVENLETVEDVNQGRLSCLQEWTERRLDDVVISTPHRDPLRLLYGSCPTLDPDTVHPKLLLSAENRRVEHSEAQQSYPELESRFTVFPQVLGSKSMSQGRHYWEVEVSLDEGRWKVGVCDGQISRKGQKDTCRIGFYPNSWCLVYEKGKVEALHNKASSPVCATELQKIGVLLDFDESCLSFYNVSEDGSLTLLYSFQNEFPEPLFPALAISKTQLTICDLFAGTTTNETD